MRRAYLFSALVVSVGCSSSPSSTGGVDSGTPPPITFDASTSDAAHDVTITGLGGDTGLTSPDTGTTPPTDTGTPADATPADAVTSTEAATDGSAPDGSIAPDAAVDAKALDASSSDGATLPTTCAAAHGSYGCCANATTVSYCGGDSGTSLRSEECNSGKACVFDTTGGYYHCGSPDAGVSTEHPAACGDVDAGSSTPDAGSTKDAETTKDTGTTKDAETTKDASSEDAAVPHSCTQANGATGCCSGQTLYYCMGDTLVSRKCIDGNVCGWAPPPVFGYYDCGSLSGEAPGDNPPKACQ